MATTAQIRNKALKMLGVVGRGQTARSEDTEDMDNAYLELHSKLELKGLTPWGENTVDVPDEFVQDIVALMAYSRMAEYNVPAERSEKILLAATVAEPNLRELMSIKFQGVTKVESF